ncbi:hypothetical protein H4219_000243 [Mycoemilia scoparia]|uniref:BED-type domain-containing protein n=1 Tax=Mycoemilia scoparia TaxID=417184 RepID=A0A9W8A359_9FUNG|nr:hypothetical protein H4219_000243 [Mycoemilia scoparia]
MRSPSPIPQKNKAVSPAQTPTTLPHNHTHSGPSLLYEEKIQISQSESSLSNKVPDTTTTTKELEFKRFAFTKPYPPHITTTMSLPSTSLGSGASKTESILTSASPNESVVFSPEHTPSVTATAAAATAGTATTSRGPINQLRPLADHRRPRSNTSPPVVPNSIRGRSGATSTQYHSVQPPQQQQQQQQQQSSAPIRHRRESTRRLSSVVWSEDGFKRLESGISRCRVCGKEYSKGSSTGTLKRHYETHQPGGSHHPYHYSGQSSTPVHLQHPQHIGGRPWSPVSRYSQQHYPLPPDHIPHHSSPPGSPRTYRGPPISEPVGTTSGSLFEKLLAEPPNSAEPQYFPSNRFLPQPMPQLPPSTSTSPHRPAVLSPTKNTNTAFSRPHHHYRSSSVITASTPFPSLLSHPAHSPPFQRPPTIMLLNRVYDCMQRLAPLSLAARSWDNVGILLEAPSPRPKATRVFLTIDLTPQTLKEAIDDPTVGVIVAYHPPIFRSLKCLTMADTKQSIILQCAAAGVSIYSPHTSLDSCAGGINDWLASIVGPGTVVPINPANEIDACGQSGAGEGRILTLTQPRHLSEIINDVKVKIGLLHIRVARSSAQEKDGSAPLIRTVAICAGSGSSILLPSKADLYLTGEMSHHEMLAAIAKGTSCILTEHSNSERGFLHHRLQPQLAADLNASLAPNEPSLDVITSQLDRDPVSIE